MVHQRFNAGFIFALLYFCVNEAIFHTLSYINDANVEILTQCQQDDERPIDYTKIIFGVSKAIFLFIHPSQYFVNQDLIGSLFKDLNTLLTTICYFRIVFVYCYLSKNSRYYGTRISRLLSVYGHRSKATNFMYAIKCLFKQKGMLANTFLLIFTITFLGLLAYLVSKQRDLLTQMYYCIQTMATIGYGQFSVSNSVQRLIFVLVIISGSFAASVFTIDLLEFLELQDREMKAYRLIKRLQYQDEIRKAKMSLIKKFFKKTPDSYHKEQKLKWKKMQKQLQVDKSPMLQFLTVKYTYFCNSLKILLERQLLSSNLLTFYFNQRQNYDVLQQQKQICNSNSASNSYGVTIQGKRRVQDSYKIYQLKEKILGYRN